MVNRQIILWTNEEKSEMLLELEKLSEDNSFLLKEILEHIKKS